MNNNIAILSAALTILGIVLAIFGASWLNQRSTEKLIEQFGRQMDARFDQVLTEIKRLDQRIDSLTQRVERIERQLEAIFKPVPPR